MQLIDEINQLKLEEKYYLRTDFCFYCGSVVEWEINTIDETRYPINPEDRTYHNCAAKEAVRGYFKYEEF